MSEVKHTPAQMHTVREALAASLGDSYDCTRVWEAWNVGTMSQDDFVPITEDDERMHELTIAALDASGAPELLEALESIRRYGLDTLSGRTDGPDDREWQREAVLEMTRRARDAIAKAEGQS